MVYLAIVLWPLGEVDRAREIADATAARIAKLNHLATSTYGLMHCAMFEIACAPPIAHDPASIGVLSRGEACAVCPVAWLPLFTQRLQTPLGCS
jgi:hypothetical protein